jgi:predicted acetyltransferase
MDADVRTLEPTELREAFVVVERAFGAHFDEAFLAFHRPFVEIDRTFGAFEDGAMVGSAGATSFAMTVPGGEIAAAGVTGVGVLPSHRRRGVNTALMRAQLDDVRVRGETVAVLYASQGSIYGRYGYGVASLNASIDVETRRSAFGPWYAPSGRVRLVERDEAIDAFPQVYDEVRRSYPGMMRLDRASFGYRLDDRLWQDDRQVPGFYAAHETDGRVDGYVQYRIRHEWDSVPKNELMVDDLIATTPAAYAGMWRYVFDIDLIHRVTAWNRPSDDPLVHLVLEPRPLHFRLKDALWVRLVDVERALPSRTYRADADLVLDVRDAFCPWNEGRFALRIDGGRAACRPTDAAADLALDVAELGAVFLGGTRPSALHRAGRVEERTPGAVVRLDAAFAWDPAPWCSFMF